jgi:raffinose synthase
MCCFRFKLWWMTQRMGTSGRDVPLETQFMLLESRAGRGTGGGDGEDGGETVYLVMLPLLEGQFRAALQGNERDELEITLESGKHAAPGQSRRLPFPDADARWFPDFVC